MSYILHSTKTLCGECGSEDWEGFTLKHGVSGIRCLSCGHTKYHNHPLQTAAMNNFIGHDRTDAF